MCYEWHDYCILYHFISRHWHPDQQAKRRSTIQRRVPLNRRPKALVTTQMPDKCSIHSINPYRSQKQTYLNKQTLHRAVMSHIKMVYLMALAYVRCHVPHCAIGFNSLMKKCEFKFETNLKFCTYVFNCCFNPLTIGFLNRKFSF